MFFVPAFLSDSMGELGLNCRQCHSTKAEGQESRGHSRLRRKYTSRPPRAAKGLLLGQEGQMRMLHLQIPMVCRTRLSLSLRWPENIR